ncbi:hypothetical protein ACW2QC_17345 [Virgibacillus sp. FSP13]
MSLLRAYRPESRNIGAKVRSSSRKREHRRENRKHRPQIESIGAKVRSSSRKQKHHPEIY